MSKNEQYAGELVGLLSQIGADKKLLSDFLADLLTPAEYLDLPKRWQIIKKLSQGIPQRQIAKSLGVGIATVTRGSRELMDKKGGFCRALKSAKLSNKI
ncbi:MAG: Trp family transcriptional regulator [Patescibacteria group bacterium]